LAVGLQRFGFIRCLHLQGRYQSVELHSIMYHNSVISMLDSVITSKPYHIYDLLKILEIYANSLYGYYMAPYNINVRYMSQAPKI
jgi:hypothetical protein